MKRASDSDEANPTRKEYKKLQIRKGSKGIIDFWSKNSRSPDNVCTLKAKIMSASDMSTTTSCQGD